MAAVALMALARPAAQSRPAETLTMDFLAIAGDGRPIRDLKPEDVTLRVDGKTRTIRSLQLMTVGDAPGSGVRTGNVETPPPFETNAVSRTGRGLMVIVDDESIPIGGERPIRAAVTQMAAELAPTDRLAIATVPHGGVKLDFTNDRGKLEQVLSTIVGQPHTNKSDQDAACQTRSVLQQTQGLLSGLDPAAGPTTVMLLTGGLVGPRSDTFGSTAGQQIGTGSIGVCELTPEHFKAVGDTASAVRAQFYVIQPEGDLGSAGAASTALFGGNVNPQVGLENLAGVTGGQVMRSATSISRVARETSAHYVATFDADPNDRRNPNHRVELKSARTDLTLRARPSLTLAKADEGGASAPRDTLKDTKPYRDLPLRSASFISRAPDQKVMVVASIEPLDPAAKLTAVAAGLYAGPRLVAEWIAKPDDLTAAPVRAGLLAAPGTYRLRVAAKDLTGKLGAVDSQVDAKLTAAGPLSLSSLVLGVPGATGGFSQRLEFSREPAAMLYFELYGGQTNMQLGAAIELATSVNGPAVATAAPKWGGTTEKDKFTATAQIPIDSLAPGDYVVRAIVGFDGQPEGRIVRTLRKR